MRYTNFDCLSPEPPRHFSGRKWRWNLPGSNNCANNWRW